MAANDTEAQKLSMRLRQLKLCIFPSGARNAKTRDLTEHEFKTVSVEAEDMFQGACCCRGLHDFGHGPYRSRSKCVPFEVRCMSEAHGSRGGHSSHGSPALKMNSVSFSTCARERLVAGTSSLVKRTVKYSVIVY